MAQNQYCLVEPSKSTFLYRFFSIYRSLFGKMPVPECKDGAPKKSSSEGKWIKSVNVDRLANPLIEHIFKGHSQFPFIEIFIHGSWADNSKTKFSDLDDLIVIDRHNLSCDHRRLLELWLNEVDMRFCIIDPLQHHGHWIIYRDSLPDYDNSYMPLNVLEDALAIGKKAFLMAEVNLDRTREGLRKNIVGTVDNMNRLFEKKKNGTINIFELKGLIGSYFIIPAYIFQFLGKEISKANAIKRASELLSANCVSLLDDCSEIRQNWNLITDSIEFKAWSLSRFLFSNPHLWRLFAQKTAPKLFPRQFPEISERSHSLFVCETMRYLSRE